MSIFLAEIINEIHNLSKLESVFMYMLQEKKRKYKEVLFLLVSGKSGCLATCHKLYIKTLAAPGT